VLDQWVANLVRIPAEPAPPDGSPGSVRIFRAGKNYYRWRILMWAVQHLVLLLSGVALILGFFNFVTRRLLGPMQDLSIAIEVVALALLLAGMPFTYYLQRLDYRFRWYMVTDRSLRIRSGIWSVEELTMTFANIQDIAVSAGPLQGFLGLADIEVRSAGGGTPGPNGTTLGKHSARFEGVDNAEALRDLIMERLRHYRDAGLGDGDHQAPVVHEPLHAAHRVLAEARALRSAIESPRTADR